MAINGDLTIDEVRLKQVALEEDLTYTLRTFLDETGLTVTGVGLNILPARPSNRAAITVDIEIPRMIEVTEWRYDLKSGVVGRGKF